MSRRRTPLARTPHVPVRAHARSPHGRTRQRLLAQGTVALMLLALAACGGSGGNGGGGGGNQVLPPTSLSYSAAQSVYRTDDPISPNQPSWSGGAPTLYEIAPALPGGLSIDAATGVISGAPLAPAPSATHTITCSNSAGSAQATVDVEVIWHQSKNLQAQALVSEDDLRHFMERTHFGFSQAHWDALQSLGLPTYVDAMTTFADTTQLETDAMAFYIPDPDFPSAAGLARWWLYMILLNQNPFQEQLALHWHDHFATATSVLNGPSLHYFIDHVNLWRHGGASNLRTLILDMTRDWAMLEWLDGVRNSGAPGQEPNENFAREYFELFLLGVDILYTQTDIEEAARAFTGYRSRFDAGTGQTFIEFDPNRHDPNDKTVLGTLIPGQNVTDDYEAMVDLTLAARAPGKTQSAVARWICQSLLTYFCYRDPPENVIDELATDLEAGGWELKPVLMKMLQSEAFFSARARVGIVKSPVEHVTGFVRTTGLVGRPDLIDNRLTIMGNRPTLPPVVDGWPADTQWFSAQAMIERANMLHLLTVSSEALQDGLNVDLLAILPTPTATAVEAVDSLCDKLQLDLVPSDRTLAADHLDQASDGSGSRATPFEAAPDDEKEARLRSVLWILGQHPLYQVR